MIDALLRLDGEHDPEIRSLCLATLNDDDALGLAALFWTQVGWFWALSVTGWSWLFAFVLADLAVFSGRWALRGTGTPRARPDDGLFRTTAVQVNLAFVALIAADVLVLTQAPSDRAAILAIILTIGFCGYVTALFTAFPALATVNIVTLTGSLTLGLAVGPSDLARPFALLVPFATLAFWLLMRRTHVRLLGSIRSQRASHLLSLHDPLTGLPNRAFMRDALLRHLSRLGAEGEPASVTVLCLDLDGFKAVNDDFGHAAGDRVLVHVAGVLRRDLGVGECVCRIGGDEYVVLLPGADQARGRGLGRAFIEAVSEPIDIGRPIPARVGVSIGAAVAHTRGSDMDDLLREADEALYTAKQAGRGRIHIVGEVTTASRAGARSGDRGRIGIPRRPAPDRLAG